MVKVLIIPVLYAFIEGLLVFYAFYDSTKLFEQKKICQKLLDHPIWWEDGTRLPTSNCLYSKSVNFMLFIFT